MIHPATQIALDEYDRRFREAVAALTALRHLNTQANSAYQVDEAMRHLDLARTAYRAHIAQEN